MIVTLRRIAPVLLAMNLPLVACNGGHTSGSPQSDAAPTERAQTAAPGAAEAHPGAAASFHVEVEAPDGAIAGKETIAKVRIAPAGSWHMNLDFPVALRIEAPGGVDVPVPTQRKADAERFDDDGLVFALPFTPRSHGAKHFAGDVAFAVCADAACSPEKVELAFDVDVACDTDAVC